MAKRFNRKGLPLLLGLFISLGCIGQAKIRKLPENINHPSMSVSAPFVSLDGQTLLFTSDYAEDNELTVFYTVRDGVDWITPSAMPKYVNNPLNFLYGYSLSGDGKTLFLSTMKYGGVGGYDIVMADFKRGSYSETQNPGMPINSKQHDASPTLTPSGDTMYFMRCETMDHAHAGGCKIYVIRKNQVGQWGEAQELPPNVNTGNCQFPRIMADGESLIFASNTTGPSRGGMDLYLTRRNGDRWTDPVPLDFVNTTGDDQFVSVSAVSRYLIRDSPGERKSELVEYLFPEELRPKGVMRVEGTILDPQGQPAPAYLSVTDVDTNNRTLSTRPGPDGSFVLYLVEGRRYEFAADPERGDWTYFTKQYDLTKGDPLNPDRINVIMKPIRPGDEVLLAGVQFEPHTSRINPLSRSELSRFSRIIKSNASLSFELQVMLEGYEEDSIQRDPDLTEIVYDSIYTIIERPDTTQYARADSLLEWANDTLSSPPDLSIANIDSMYHQMLIDTILVVKTRYHNDRTRQQAEAIVKELGRLGADTANIAVLVNAQPAVSPGDRRTIIKAVARSLK